MGKKKHRRSKSSPGEWKRSDSFDSVIEESPNHDHHHHHHHDHYGFSWSAITNIENLKKKDESESAATINVNFGITVKSKSLGVSVNFNDEKVGEDFPIFKHFNSSSSSSSASNNSSTSLPPPPPPPQQHQHHHSFSHSSSGNSSISLRIPSPSPNVSSVSNSSAKKTSHSYSGEAHQAHRKKSISGESSGGLENSFELTFPVSNFGESEPDTFVGRMKSIMQSPPQVQAMERSGDQGYDPHRIPSAIFETNRTIEWSATSNESLFSLNLGRTNSLSPEKLLAYGDHMIKSGELDPLSAYKFTTPRTSDSDHSLAYRISDVEIDLLKKIEEDEDTEKEIEKANQEPIIELSNEVADGTNTNKTDPNSTNANSKHITDNIPSFKVEELSVKIASPKFYKNTEDSVKSTDSFSFQVVEDETKARDRRPNSSKHIKVQQSFPNPKSPYHKQKAKSKSWFSYCLSCCGLCSCLSVLCCNPCSCCSGGSSCSPSCKCTSCSPSCTCSSCAPSCTCSSCAPSCTCSSCVPSCNCCSSCSLPSCNCCSSCSLPSCTCKSPWCCGSCSWCCCFSCSSCRCFSCSGSSFCCCGSCRGSHCCC